MMLLYYISLDGVIFVVLCKVAIRCSGWVLQRHTPDFPASFIESSHVKLKEQTWRKNKKFVEFCVFISICVDGCYMSVSYTHLTLPTILRV